MKRNAAAGSGVTSVEAYIRAAAKQAQPVLREIRQAVQTALPDALESISYRMPAFRLGRPGGHGRVFFYYAAFKHHIGVYPPLHTAHPLWPALKPFANARGNLAFPLHQPVPVDLITRVASALAVQYDNRAASDETK